MYRRRTQGGAGSVSAGVDMVTTAAELLSAADARGATALHLQEQAAREELASVRRMLHAQQAAAGRALEEELGVAMKALGAPVSATELSALVKEIDEDGNGELDLEEFEVLLERFGIFEDFMHVASS